VKLIAGFAFLLATILAAQPAPGKTVLYAALGPDLTQYDLDAASGTLTRRATVTLPANVQEAWPHPSHRYLYVTWSDNTVAYSPSIPGASKGSRHGVTAFRIDPATGALTAHGQPAMLPSRSVFISTDVDGTHLLAAHNDPSGLTVYRILPDGTLGASVPPAAPLDVGIYGHQVRVDPSNRAVILITRGNAPTATKPEDPGALKIYNYANGVLSNRLSIAPGGGLGYQVRHLDFHPSGKWVYVTLERQNQIHVYSRTPDGTLSTAPVFVKDTVKDPKRRGQSAASIHVHPNGRFLYMANRGGAGESSIAVFAINQETGEPTLIQSIDTRGIQPRTFSLDAAGRFLLVANQTAQPSLPASLALFRIGSDGKLEFARKYDVDATPARLLFWAGFVTLP
jgi:6-phosphogluconolactonase